MTLLFTKKQQLDMENKRDLFNKVLPAHKGKNLVMRDDTVLNNVLTQNDPMFKGATPYNFRIGKGFNVKDQNELVRSIGGKKSLLNHQ